MADNPFGTPVSALALEMAVRNQELAERIPTMTENQRRLINLRLQKYGGDLADYESFMDVGYNPAANALRSQAEGMRDYLVGMPELMAKAMKEGQKSGVSYRAPDVVPPFDIAAVIADFDRQRAENERKQRDINEASDAHRRTTIPGVSASTQRPPATATRLRPVRGNY